MFIDELNTVLVKDIMSTNVVTAGKDETLLQGIRLMLKNNVGEILIVEGDSLLGILTLTDLSSIYKKVDLETQLNRPLIDFAHRKVLTIDAGKKAIEARNLMKEKSIGRLPVLEDGKLIGIIGLKDILNKVYTRIEEVRKTLTLILDNLHEAVCVVDENGTVVLWSKRAEELYEVPKEEIIGSHLSKFFPTALLLQVLKEKRPLENVYHSPRKGSFVNLSGIPLYVNGRFVGAVSTDRDVTEVTKLSDKLEKTRDRLRFLQKEVYKINKNRYSFGLIIGKSEKIRKPTEKAQMVARTNSSVLITGESGTGKEIFARAIHQASGRNGPFVPVNCSAIPKDLFESEMFGYVAGAFTGASRKGKLGKFELADGGTLFLDEIGDMPLFMQAKILRVLQEKKISRIGAENPIEVDVRVISATNRDLWKMVEEGNFREDLFYRLNVVNIELPPLRERIEDIPLLVEHFMKEYCRDNKISLPRINSDVMERLIKYEWKGNIRELKNTVEHLVIFARDGEINMEDLPEYILKNFAENKVVAKKDKFDLQKQVEQTEIEAISRVMKLVEGNKSKAAKMLNIPRSTLYYKLKYYNLTDYL